MELDSFPTPKKKIINSKKHSFDEFNEVTALCHEVVDDTDDTLNVSSVSTNKGTQEDMNRLLNNLYWSDTLINEYVNHFKSQGLPTHVCVYYVYFNIID